MTVIQWVSDFSERVKQLQSVSQAAASGGAKELKVRAAPRGRLGLGRGPWGGGGPLSPAALPHRTSTCAWAACSCPRPTSPLPGSTWPRPTAGPWRSSAWRCTSPPPRAPRWTPAASGSPVSGGTPAWLPSGSPALALLAFLGSSFFPSHGQQHA